MPYVSARTSWALFALAVLLLIFLGIATDRSTSLFADSAQWVSHTREVETNLQKVRADLFAAESGRQGYILSGTPAHQDRFQKAKQDISSQLPKLRALTKDNPEEQQRLDLLEPAIKSRLDLLDESLALRNSGKPDRERQNEITAIGLQRSLESMALLDDMKQEEGRL